MIYSALFSLPMFRNWMRQQIWPWQKHLYRAANKYEVKYILEGHSFITEGVAPLGNIYFDGAYIKNIHEQFGTMKMKTYPLHGFLVFHEMDFDKKNKENKAALVY